MSLSALRSPLPPLTRAQGITFVLFTLGIAVTRFSALSLTLHDWDETLFAAAVSEYDVAVQRPHPPGYPLFIAAAKLARIVAGTDFHALQAVATLGSMLVFPAAFLLARSLRFSAPFAFAAGALTAFLPPVWYYGGTGLSDVPALVLGLASAALLLRGGRRAYSAGVVVAALALGVRPQVALMLAVPAVVGVIGRMGPRGRVGSMGRVGSWAGAAGLVFVTYLGAAFFSSDFPRGYLEETREIEAHLRETDSFRNPLRTPLPELAPRVFLFPLGGGRIRYAVVALAAIALVDAIVRRRTNVALLLATFFPIAVFTWLMLDMTALPRYVIAYVPLHAFLAVAGVEAIAQLVPSRPRLPLFALLTAFLTWSLIKWTWPALRFARTEPSPPVAAFQWIRTNVPRVGPRVYVDSRLVYHARFLIPDYDFRLVFHDTPPDAGDFAPGNVFVFEGEPDVAGARMFRRKRLQLFELARPRFFEVGIVPMRRIVRYGKGWHQQETDGQNRWRWMQREAEILLAPPLYGRGELRLRLHAPVDVTPRPPVVTVTWNGTVIDRRTPPSSGNLDLTYLLASRSDRLNELRLSTDLPIRPKDDGRELGLNLHAISWSEPSPESVAAAPLQ